MSQPTHPNSPGDQWSPGAPAQYPSYPTTSPYATPAAMGAQGAPPPPSNAGWAVAAVLFFWPLAFSAFTHLHNVFPLWATGDFAGAQLASDRVKTLGKLALGIFVGVFLLFVVLYGLLIATVLSQIGSYN
jgi:hypothetical protein